MGGHGVESQSNEAPTTDHDSPDKMQKACKIVPTSEIAIWYNAICNLILPKVSVTIYFLYLS